MDKPFCVVDNFNDLMKPLNWKETQGFLFRIRCHHCQIIMEFFHALTDAGGSMTILLTLLREYLRLKYAIDIPTDQKILDCDMVITSYNNQTSLIFTRTTPNTDVERHFFDSLVKAGIPVQIESIGSRD